MNFLKFLLPISFLVAFMPSAHADHFSMHWWNIGGGNFWAESPQPRRTTCYAKDASEIEKNLIAVAHQNRSPDVLAFAEYFDGFLSPKTLADVGAIYPYSYGFLYNRLGRPYEIFVLSKLPASDQRSVFEGLHWAQPEEEQRSENLSYYYLRSYQRLSFQLGKFTLNFVPLHAVDPWGNLIHQWGGDDYLSRVRGFLETGLSMMFSQDNPSAVQAKSFQQELHADPAWQSADSFWVVMGDFNLPDEVLGVTPMAFNHFKGPLAEVSLSQRQHHQTFPSVSCAEYKKLPHLRIDHALTESFLDPKKVSMKAKAKILDESGSDHFPIQLDLKW